MSDFDESRRVGSIRKTRKHYNAYTGSGLIRVTTDQQYQAPALKSTTAALTDWISEMEVFQMLDRLKATATGLDRIPAWFLRLGAPVFAAPIAQLFNQSIIAGVVPSQWKIAIITPVPKVKQPAHPADFRPISITPILSRTLERFIVRSFIYPAIQQPNHKLFLLPINSQLDQQDPR